MFVYVERWDPKSRGMGRRDFAKFVMIDATEPLYDAARKIIEAREKPLTDGDGLIREGIINEQDAAEAKIINLITGIMPHYFLGEFPERDREAIVKVFETQADVVAAYHKDDGDFVHRIIIMRTL